MSEVEPQQRPLETNTKPVEEFDFPERVPDFERDEDVIRVKLDNAILTKFRALHFLEVYPKPDSGRKLKALEWLNSQGVFSVMIDDVQVACRFIVRGRAGSEVICMFDDNREKSFVVSNMGVKEALRLCVFKPAVFDALVALALTAQEKFSEIVEKEIKSTNQKGSRSQTFSLDAEAIRKKNSRPVISVRMQAFEADLLAGASSFRQVVTPEPEMSGSCTYFFNWLGGQLKQYGLTPAVKFEDEQIQIALVDLELGSQLYKDLVAEYERTFGTQAASLFPSLLEVSEIVNHFLTNIITEKIGTQRNKGRVQRTKLNFDDLNRIRSLMVGERMPRIRLGRTLVDISDESRVMVPTIYISF